MYDFNSTYNRLVEEASKYQCLKKSGLDKNSDIIPMTTADMDFPLAPEIREAIKEYVSTHVLGYSKVTEEYIDTCIDYYKKQYNYSPKKDSIVTVPGIVTALSTSVAAYSEPGDKVIIFTPVYPPFSGVVKMQGREICESKLIDSDGYYTIDFENLEKLASDPKVKLILLCNPHNPGGRVWTREELENVERIARKNNLIVVSDEIHSDIVFEPLKHTCYGTIDGSKDHCVVCHAASKTYNIAGLQCSNIIIENKELYDKFVNVNLSRGIERANVLGMVATKAAYEKAGDWKKEMKNVIAENFEVLQKFFENKKEFKLAKTEASFLAWLNYKNLNVSHERFMEALNEFHFLAADGLDYGEAGEYYIRINVGLPKNKLIENLERFEKCIQSIKN